jgi:hypothetical protein
MRRRCPMRKIVACCLAVLVGSVGRAEDPVVKKEPKVYTIRCKYVEVGKDGKEKVLAMPTIVAEEGTPAVCQTKGQMSFLKADGNRAVESFGNLLEVRTTSLAGNRVRSAVSWTRSEPSKAGKAGLQVPQIFGFQLTVEAKHGEAVKVGFSEGPGEGERRFEITVDEFREVEDDEAKKHRDIFEFYLGFAR